MDSTTTTTRKGTLAIIGPGILVAATGVGAGDLATAAFTGNKLGLAILWAVVLGALLKYVLNEGLARWQLATGTTLIEGAVAHFGQPLRWALLGYLFLWSFLVGSALISACGVAAHAIAPLVSPEVDKVIYGLGHSALALLLVKLGGYRVFSKVMSACIGVMFVVVVLTAVALCPSWAEVGAGLLVPRIPQLDGAGLQWTIALLGGVGGTLTVLCYGYWIREEGRSGAADLKLCRLDLAAGYVMTACFGLSMVIIGSQTVVQGGGAALIANLGAALEARLGAIGTGARWAFLVGAWGAVFSSLLGVWQSLPYLFCDLWGLRRGADGKLERRTVDSASRSYNGYLYALASVPALGLVMTFEAAQKLYAVVGALFIPMLALALLLLNGRRQLVGERFRNSWLTTLLLVACLAFFAYVGWLQIEQKLFG